jgi:hypothetical protein
MVYVVNFNITKRLRPFSVHSKWMGGCFKLFDCCNWPTHPIKVQFNYQSRKHVKAMQFCRTVGVPLPSVIVMTAGSKHTSLAGPPRKLHNAFHAIMAESEQLYHYSNYLSREDVARAFSGGTSKGQLAQRVATYLQDSGAGFSSGTSDRERKNVLILLLGSSMLLLNVW